MKKGRRALSLKKRLDNQNIYDHAQINEKKSSTNTSFRTCRKESAGQNVKSACGGLCVRSHTASRRAVSGASCPCGAGLASTQSLGTQCTITIINGSGMTLGSACGRRCWRSTRPNWTCPACSWTAATHPPGGAASRLPTREERNARQRICSF